MSRQQNGNSSSSNHKDQRYGYGHPGYDTDSTRHETGGMKLARAYVPRQTYGQIYDPREALQKGTIFPELYRLYPY